MSRTSVTRTIILLLASSDRPHDLLPIIHSSREPIEDPSVHIRYHTHPVPHSQLLRLIYLQHQQGNVLTCVHWPKLSVMLVSNRSLSQMVMTRQVYDDEEPPSFRRHSSRGDSYPLSYDREVPSGQGYNMYPRPHHLGSQDSRREHSENDEIPNKTRSRIPVAVS